MRNEEGISIILTDSDVETKQLLEIVHAKEAFPLGMLPQLCLSHPDAVYYETLVDPEQLKRLVKCLSIRRGVLSIKGKREFLGFNANWMREVMAARHLEEVSKATDPERDYVNLWTKPEANKHPTPTLVYSAPEEEEREDPYLSLGYRR